ncbi:MAG: radical SAM protein [Pleurocapsa minor GSE-CHR-MK-17-07R]|jgi:MoaA/NifB/PqqE/SkfB family radical SAM enzyme|nr:radical SAM protein [Pleurocapsa minor GSE-CHR-MK 17-07R]
MSIHHLPNLVSSRLSTLPIAVLYLTDGCNSRCIMCDIWKSPRRNMDMNLIASLAGDAASLRMKWVVLSGGEAMQHPEWPDIARQFRAQGVRVILLTNGLLLKKQSADVIAQVDELVVSIDAGKAATYARIRGVDALDLVFEGITLARQAGIPVTTRTTIQRDNYAELDAIITRAVAADVNHISFLAIDTSNPFAFGPRFEELPADLPLIPVSPHQPPAGALSHDDIALFEASLETLFVRHASLFASGRISESPDKLRRMVPYFHASLAEGPFPPVRCNAPQTSVVIEVDGTIRPCYFLPAVGKLNGGLRAAINSPEAVAMRDAVRSGQRRECGKCVCPLYKGPRSLMSL